MDRRERNHTWYHHFDAKRMVITLIDPDYLESDEQINEVPACFEVCETCNGKGSHVNPSIDSHGLSREDFDEDSDFAEDYFSWRYDVQCSECHGRRVVPVVDESRASAAQQQAAEDVADSFFRNEAEIAHERRMGY